MKRLLPLVFFLAACPAVEPDPTPAPTPEPTPAEPPSSNPDDWPGPGAACGLEADLDDPHFLEGDRVQFGLRCSAGDIDDFELTPIRVPDEGYDPATRAVDWTTDLADGGRYDLVFGVRPADDPDAVPQAEVVTFWVADDPTAFGDVRPVPEDYTEEWGIPVFHIDPQGGVSQEYTSADITYRGRTYDGAIKVRGASSTAYDKKSFTIEFNAEELPIEEWGVTRDHLYLVTSFDDNSYVRQKLVYDQWMAMAEYWASPRLTPRTFFAVLYLDGEYHGLYTAIDRPDNEFLDHMGFARDSNLYKSVNHDANYYYTRANGSQKGSLHDGYEKEEGIPGDWSDLDALVDWAAGSEYQAVIDEAGQWIDLGEWMDWFLLVHYGEGGDSAGKNIYIANDPLTSPEFHVHPWDFNHVWGQDWRTFRIPSNRQTTFDNRNRIFAAIHATAANDDLWNRFRAMRTDGPYALSWMHGKLDEYYSVIDKSAARDWAKWQDAYYSFGRWSSTRAGAGDFNDYEGEKAYVYGWIQDRDDLFRVVYPD